MRTSGIKSKAGISWPVQEGSSDPVAKFFQLGSLSWHWNWNKNWDVILPETSKSLTINADFVPMIFAKGYFENEFKLQEGHTHIMGFNEPDMDNPAVAQRCSPEDAAKEWLKIAALRSSSNTKLVSPAVAHDIHWLKSFLDLLPQDAKPDCIAVHVYTTTFGSFQEKVEEFWNTFHLPIWVTEFSMTSFDPNVPPPNDMQQVHDFMGQTTDWMDKTDYIERYSWFGACRDGGNLHGVHPLNRLMDEQGNVTALGHQYINGGHD